jgi:5-aminolevulinate synthase
MARPVHNIADDLSPRWAEYATRPNYDSLLSRRLDELRQEGGCRAFPEHSRQRARYPLSLARIDKTLAEVVVWSSDDYLGMAQSENAIAAMKVAIDRYGVGAGGPRSGSGNSPVILELEEELATFHEKQAGLVFSSSYVANEATLSTLAGTLPACVVLSDERNHASMADGIREGGAEQVVFRHNDLDHLESLLAALPASRCKVVAFESIHSMDGDIAPVGVICEIAHRHGALTYLNEAHAVGMYGPTGAGIAERDGAVGRVDIVQGSLAKAFGAMGGYVAGSRALVDTIRSQSRPVLFTAAMPPAIAAGALANVRHLKSSTAERIALHRISRTVRTKLLEQGLPVVPGASHIISLVVGGALRCNAMADSLLRKHGIWVQPQDHPTVPRGTERIRITPTALHTSEMAVSLTSSLIETWTSLGLSIARDGV